MSQGPINVPNDFGFPRISKIGLIGGIFAFLGIAIISAGGRTYLRIKRFGKIELDDFFLLFGLIALAAASGIIYQLGDLLYLQIYASLNLIPIPTDTRPLLRDAQLLQAASVLVWTSLFSTKIALLIFFRKLVDRVYKLETWWRIVLGALIVLACVCIPLGFIECTDFSISFLKTCPVSFFETRERIYLDVSVTIDLISDALILSIPIALLYMVKLEFRRKMALAAVLCLTIFDMIIAIVRVAASALPGGITDTAWLFFWQTMEAALAIIIVSLTVIKSFFGASAATSSKKALVYKPNGEDSDAQSRVNRQYNQISPSSLGRPSTANPVRFGDQEEDLEELASFDHNIHVSNKAFISDV